jgi:polysaccharide pyruvyl transferase WcaK-like protein
MGMTMDVATATATPRATGPVPPCIAVALLWHSVNSDNLGIGALTASHVAVISKVALDLGVAVRFEVVGWRAPQPDYIQFPGLDVFAMRARDLLRPGGLYAAARRSEIVLDVSTGDAFADIYGARRFVFNALGKLAVLLARRPLVMSPQTIGPFERRWARVIAGLLMRRARNVVTRDRLSTEFAASFGLGSKLVESTDLAFRLPYETPDKHRGPTRFGLNVSGLLFNGGYTRDNMFALGVDYPELVRCVIRHFVARPDCEVHLIGHVNSDAMPVEDDFRVARQLAEDCPGAVVAPRFDDPSQAKSYIAGMDFFCGSRMHACIAAFSSGVPVLPLAYSRKFAGVFGSLGYHEIADCRTQSADEILAAVVSCYERRSELKAAIEEGRRRAEAKLAAYEAVLRECLAEAVLKHR